MAEGGREMRLPCLRPSLRSGFQLTAMTCGGLPKISVVRPFRVVRTRLKPRTTFLNIFVIARHSPSIIARHSPSIIARHASAEAIPRLNPKLKALNPEQILISIVNHKTIYNFACFFRNVKSPLGGH